MIPVIPAVPPREPEHPPAGRGRSRRCGAGAARHHRRPASAAHGDTQRHAQQIGIGELDAGALLAVVVECALGAKARVEILRRYYNG